MLALPPKIYVLHPFVCFKFYQKAFCTIKKKKQKKKTQKKNKDSEETLAETFPSRFCFFWFLFFCFFLFFRFFRFTVASDIFLKKHFPLPAFGIHYFPKKKAFPKIFPANYFKLLSIKKKNQKKNKIKKQRL